MRFLLLMKKNKLLFTQFVTVHGIPVRSSL